MLPLSEALLVVLYLMGGKIRTQFTWNLQLFLCYMWLSDKIPMRPYKFVATPFGAWCPKIKKEIDYLEEKELISCAFTAIEYIDDLDKLINEDFFDTTKVFTFTDLGRHRLQDIIRLYKLDIDAFPINNILYMVPDADIPFLLETIKDRYPELIKKKTKKKS